MWHLPSSRRIPSPTDVATPPALALCMLFAATAALAGQAPATAPAATGELRTHLAALASLEYPTRTNAARMVRRAPAADAVPLLAAAARSNPDEFVRYRALVLLTSFNDPGTAALMAELLRDRNDRLREVAYKWLEQSPQPRLTETLLGALQTEQAEFVRPALVRALAALGSDPLVQRALTAEITRGLDFFRGAVIEALGYHRATYAVDAIAGVAALDGPLQDDAVLALGRIGGVKAQAALAAVSGAPVDLMLTVRGAQCLLAQRCDTVIKGLSDAAAAPSASPAVIRAAIEALAAVAASGNETATASLLALSGRARTLRDEVALGFATVAVRKPEQMIAWFALATEPQRVAAMDLLKEGFDRLEEDFGEEQFFAASRAAYWKAAEGSTGRTLSSALIQKLEF